LEAGVGENEKRRVHRLTHLSIEMWATEFYWADVGHPPRSKTQFEYQTRKYTYASKQR
jgi:hypothetical protein